MKFINNRFAIFPAQCTVCHRYVWLESYRKASVWNTSFDRCIDEVICRDCISRFNVGIKQK